VGSFQSLTLSWWQINLLKVSLIALGVGIGTTWYEFFGRWIAVVWAVFLTTAACRAYFWWRLSATVPGGTERAAAPK
jgi:hypothetical protein